MGGISSGLMNLVFDNTDHDKRADSLAICQAISGTAGFLATLAASALVTAIQASGNKLFGITVYAQQILSALGAIVGLLCALYIRLRLIKKK